MATPGIFNRKGILWTTAVMVLAAVAVAIFFSTRKDSDTLSVPLGVEQAAIVTYSGPLVEVAPYKWGVAVNVRIAELTELPGKRVYDVRYIVNRAGTFDLKDYLVAADGSSLDDLPTFKFSGDAKLSKDLDTRIQETEEIRVDVGGRYYETLALLGVLWIAWLLLLIFYKRQRPAAKPDPGPAEPTIAEMLRVFLDQLEAGTLDAAAKAKMEMALLRCWRNELDLSSMPMNAAFGEIGRSEETAEPLRKLQHWLYHPDSSVKNDEIAAVVAPYTTESKSPRAAANPA